MNPTRLRTLLVTAAVCALAAWLAVGAAFAGLAFAKASSVAAAVFGGLAAGFLIYVAGSLGKTIPRHDAIVAGSTLAAAVLLAAAALYLERCCRAPRPPDEDDFPPPADGQRPRYR